MTLLIDRLSAAPTVTDREAHAASKIRASYPRVCIFISRGETLYSCGDTYRAPSLLRDRRKTSVTEVVLDLRYLVTIELSAKRFIHIARYTIDRHPTFLSNIAIIPDCLIIRFSGRLRG